LTIQLSKEEEGEGNADAEVTREDQDKINAFSRLHRREKMLEEELQTKQVRRGNRCWDDASKIRLAGGF
jgi:hypothetical protein